jgi:hypothetical protein
MYLLWDGMIEILEESKCPNYINKAIRELNLEYIYNINKIYFEKN